MDLIKKIAPRILLLGLIILISNFIYINTSYQSDLDKDGNILNKFEKAIVDADALYFSASPNGAVYRTDSDKSFISKMIDDQLVHLKVKAVDTGAIHAGVFKNLIRMIPDASPVEYIIVNMNYRSFGAGWIHSKLENSIQKQMVFYNNRPAIINRFLQGLNYYECKTSEERNKMMLDYWASAELPFDPPQNNVEDWCAVEKWGDWTNPKRQLADHYIKNFAFTLDENNPRIQDFDEIVEICKEKGLKLFFVILPENLEEAELLVGKDLTDLMIDNKNYLVERYENKGAIMIDNFDLVSDSCFIERNFPSEHYKQTGREKIASSVANVLSQHVESDINLR